MQRSWLSFMLAAVLAGAATAPVWAAAGAPVSYNLTLTGTTYSGTRPSGTIAGLFGGVGVEGSYANGVWSLQAYGHRFAAGTYVCIRICSFTGTALAGRAVAYAWTSPVPAWDARDKLVAGQIAGLFGSPYDWSALVSAWAQATGLPPGLQTRVTLDAQVGM